MECLPVCLLFEKVIKRNLVPHIYLHWDLYFISPPKMGLGGQGTVQEKNDRGSGSPLILHTRACIISLDLGWILGERAF